MSISTIYLIDALTHKCLGSLGYETGTLHGFEWARRVVGSEYRCNPDDVRTEETEDGEFLTANGERVAYVTREAPLPDTPLFWTQQAAE